MFPQVGSGINPECERLKTGALDIRLQALGFGLWLRGFGLQALGSHPPHPTERVRIALAKPRSHSAAQNWNLL